MSIFKVEKSKSKATLLFRSQGEYLDKIMICEAAKVAYTNDVCVTIYKDDADVIVILFSGVESSIEKIEEFYNND